MAKTKSGRARRRFVRWIVFGATAIWLMYGAVLGFKLCAPSSAAFRSEALSDLPAGPAREGFRACIERKSGGGLRLAAPPSQGAVLECWFESLRTGRGKSAAAGVLPAAVENRKS